MTGIDGKIADRGPGEHVAVAPGIQTPPSPLVYVLMNDQAYGVIQNIQDAQYDSRRHYSKIAVPDFAGFCKAIAMPHTRVGSVDDFPAALEAALAAEGPQLIEVDMCAIGPFAGGVLRPAPPSAELRQRG